jgi:hypothetical protein
VFDSNRKQKKFFFPPISIASIKSTASRFIAGITWARCSSGGWFGYASEFPSRCEQGHPTLDASGSVVGRQAHLPFGEGFAESGTQQKQHFTTYERDSKSGTDYAVKELNLLMSGDSAGAKTASPLPSKRAIRYEILTGMQDRSGYIWLSTGDGAIRFDQSRHGWRKYTQITVEPELISEDKLGRIWFADRETVVVYDKAKDSTVTLKLPNPLLQSSNHDVFIYLKAMCQDKQGRMLFALNQKVLCYYEATDKWELFILKGVGLDDYINDIIEDRIGRIWVATNQGIVLLAQ